ncbi:pyridoxal-phosphate-dependent aminotransferase family protein [Nitrospira defluvii]|uniref:(S)-ureidoglycine--glyoxylate transaminase n=1 Tax=Nitrospira defluvii TaxID=330214 RepID=A0ABM8QCI3_9BACT|nr:alanine--glyoxylate aminotransferase family protein [Nitrospira defluvii]CAE6689408.1 (S)-ureidoglycine--glyoxylate transaminase [Nitrospira defluvii]
MSLPPQDHEFLPPYRLLLGPGPSMVHPRVLHALSQPLVGHLDPLFLDLMNDIQALLRATFQTNNEFTIALSGTGSAGMEAVIANLIEPGDRALVGVNGVFGTRLATMIERQGGVPLRIDASWGDIIPAEAVREQLARSAPVKAVVLVHAETSTGARQPLEDVGALCRAHGALLIVDAVTSLGGIPVEVDAWGIDACYSGTQKCLSCPPGLAPLTMSPRAMEAIRQRQTPCHSWYLDLALIADYWNDRSRAYHHTAPISMLYALREALRLVQAEGREARFARHRLNSEALLAGLETLGLTPLPATEHRLPMLNCVTLPDRINDAAVRTRLLEDYGIEIGGGLGPLRGRVWRIGLMGESSREAHVLTLLGALEEIFAHHGWPAQPGRAVHAAVDIYTGSQPTTRRST